MPHQHKRSSLISAISTLSAAVALTWAGLAHADDPNPYYIGASSSVGYDSNVLRLPKAQGDTTYSFGLLGGLDQTIGRQRLYASGTLQEARFAKLKDLNYTSYNALAGIDWQTLYDLSGTLSYSTNQSLYSYGGTNTVRSNGKNVETRDEIIARGRWGGISLLSLDTSFTHRKIAYSDPAYSFNALNQDGWSVGLTYKPRALLTLGTAFRYTQGKYQLTRDFDRYDIDLTGTWTPTGQSSVSARLSYGDRKARNGFSELDFKGTTGQLSWSYQPTGKLRFTTSFSHDSGAESGFINLNGQQLGGVGDNSRLTDTLTINSIYNLTAKIQINAGLLVSNRSLKTGPFNGNDTLRTASLGANYAVFRNASLGCSLRRETRSASGQGSYDFRASSVSCSAQISLQ